MTALYLVTISRQICDGRRAVTLTDEGAVVHAIDIIPPISYRGRIRISSPLTLEEAEELIQTLKGNTHAPLSGFSEY